MTRRSGLIFTADDFGLHPAVNAAVEEAHRGGVLTAASLMMGAPAAADAVARAHRMPTLRVGLHLVLTDGRPVLPRSHLPAWVGPSGLFAGSMTRAAFRLALRPAAGRQLDAEIEAQFAAFAATGLRLDHLNAHKHFHFHPLILARAIAIGRRHGLRAVRLPAETGGPPFLRLLARRMRGRLEAAGLAHNDQVVGLAATGNMDERAVLAGLASLQPGITEFYFHPGTATGAEIAPQTMAHYHHREELAALTSPAVRAAVARSGLPTGGFTDLCVG